MTLMKLKPAREEDASPTRRCQVSSSSLIKMLIKLCGIPKYRRPEQLPVPKYPNLLCTEKVRYSIFGMNTMKFKHIMSCNQSDLRWKNRKLPYRNTDYDMIRGLNIIPYRTEPKISVPHSLRCSYDGSSTRANL